VAMTPPNPSRPDQSRKSTRDAHLDAAIGAIRARADTRWLEIADRVRNRALQSTRRSLPVNAQSPGGTVRGFDSARRSTAAPARVQDHRCAQARRPVELVDLHPQVSPEPDAIVIDDAHNSDWHGQT